MNSILASHLLAAGVIVLGSCASAPESTPSSVAEEQQVERLKVNDLRRLTIQGEKNGIHNYSRIDGSSGFAGSTVGFGGATTSSAMPWLRGEGFSTVINLRDATEEGVDLEGCRTAAEAVGLNYVHLPFDPESGDTQVIDEFLAAVGDEANQPVYIHCHSATRVAALWMIGRVLRDGWELGAAREEGNEIAAKPEEADAFATQFLASRR